jgi:hypothetical protein
VKIIPDCRLPPIHTGRGGRRIGAGRPLIADQPIERVSVGIDAQTKDKARQIGEGNISKGIRIAVKSFPI